MERARLFAKLPQKEQRRFLDLYAQENLKALDVDCESLSNQKRAKENVNYFELLTQDFVRAANGNSDSYNSDLSDSLYTISNIEGRSAKVDKALGDKISNAPTGEQRRRRTERSLLEPVDPMVRQSLFEWYQGRCQICDQTFFDRDGKPFFVAGHIVERKHAAWLNDSANTICFCPDHFAKWRHGSRQVVKSLPEQIEGMRLRTEGNENAATLSVSLCGENCTIKYDDRHALELRRLLAKFTAPSE